MSDFQIYDYTFLAKNDFLNFIFVSFSLFVLAQAEEQQQNVLQRRRGQDQKYVDLKILEPLTTESIFTLSLKTDTRHNATIACKKWRELAASIYEHVYNKIIDD